MTPSWVLAQCSPENISRLELSRTDSLTFCSALPRGDSVIPLVWLHSGLSGLGTSASSLKSGAEMGKLGSWGIKSGLETPAIFVRPTSICLSFTPGRVSRKKDVVCSHVRMPSACFCSGSPGPGLQGHPSRLPRVSERGPDKGLTPSGHGFHTCAPFGRSVALWEVLFTLHPGCRYSLLPKL